MEERNYEYSNLISELDYQNYELIIKNRKTEEQYNDLKSEYEFLKESYDEMMKENSELRNSNREKDEKVGKLSGELEEVKNVIGKLTEVRVILNKYFSSYFENFTPQEKKLIQEVSYSLVENSKNQQTMKKNNLNQSVSKSQRNNQPQNSLFNE
jgi:predicted nuclease with TOPRIM domain